MEEDEGCSMIEEREELMVPPNNDSQPTLKTAHFLKPILNPNHKSFPEFLPPKHPLIPNLQHINKRVCFKAIVKPLNSWKLWVDYLQKTHEETWKKVGIFDAIKASTYQIMRHNKLIIQLSKNWCCETNTFVFPWGECTVTLEDVMILGGFSVLGYSARSQFRITEGGDVQKMLFEAKRQIQKKYKRSSVSHDKWMSYFSGRGGELEHVAFIVLWLSRYVFTRNSYSLVNSNVFSIAISLSRGARLALAPAMLALIYRDLRLLKQEIVHCMIGGQDDGSKLLIWAPLQLVQVWAWERFPSLSPEPGSLAYGEPRVARWHEIKESKTGNVRVGFESAGGVFLWRPYALQLQNWETPRFYCDQEKWVLVDSEDEKILSFARCLMSCELGGICCSERYLPQRVALQFALDQDVPFSAPTTSDASELAWNSYEKPLDGLKLYLPPRLSEGNVSLRYYKWRNKGDGVDCLGNNNIAMPNENSTYFEANKLVGDAAMNLSLEAEDAGKYNERNENSSTENMCVENKPQDVAHSLGSGDEIRIEIVALVDLPPGFEVEGGNRQGNDKGKDAEVEVNDQSKNMITGTSTPDEQGDQERDDVELKQHQNLVGDPVNISDDEEYDVVKAFIAQADAFEARISRVERIISIHN